MHLCRRTIPQNPELRPTEKQLLSLLKAADSEHGPVDSSMTWRVFMIAAHDVGGEDRAKIGSWSRPDEAATNSRCFESVCRCCQTKFPSCESG